MTFNEQVQEIAKVLDIKYLSFNEIVKKILKNNINISTVRIKYILETLSNDNLIVKKKIRTGISTYKTSYKINKKILDK